MHPIPYILMSYALPDPRPLWAALAVTVAFTVIGRAVRGVSRSGAIAGAAVCFLLYAGAGPAAFVALVTVFVLAWLTTRWGYQQKQKLGTAEKHDGRSASQVLANLGVAAVCAVLFATRARSIYLLAMTAALSEAAADTVSSEVGQARGSVARLITTWESVPAGANGGVSAFGTCAGIAAAAIVSSISALTAPLPWKWLVYSTGAAAAGMLADSYMGALLESRGLLNNDSVNFLGTLVAAAVSFLLA